jgi:hypothetical protein
MLAGLDVFATHAAPKIRQYKLSWCRKLPKPPMFARVKVKRKRFSLRTLAMV